MSGIESGCLVFIIEQLSEAIGQQADDVLSRVNGQCSLTVRHRQPQLNVIRISIRWLAES